MNMDRKTFIRQSCMACAGMVLGTALLESCMATKYAKGTLNDNGMLVDLKEFDNKKGQHPYVIVRHDDLLFPICVYRVSETQYSAVLMKCSHQGAELQAAGDQLTCPAHGSEFDKFGKAMQGPATDALRTFPVSRSNGQLFIDLRKQA